MPGDIAKGEVEDIIVSVRENTVGALLGEGLLPMLKLVVGDEVGDAALAVWITKSDIAGFKYAQGIVGPWHRGQAGCNGGVP